MEEIWKEYHRGYVVNQSGVCKLRAIYEVSNLGRIKKNGEIYNLKYHKNAYLYAPGLYNGKLIYLHRLVAILFIPNKENKLYVDHIDCNKHNNRVDNLRWVTNSENMLNPITNKHVRESLKLKRESGTYKKSTANFKGENNPSYGKHWHLDKITRHRIYE